MTIEGKMENLLDACPFSEQGVWQTSFADIDGNGSLELVAIDVQWDYDATDLGWQIPSVSRVFHLRECEYQDVSALHPGFYEHTINVFFRNFDHLGGTLTRNGVFSAFEGLLACDVVGRRDECWPLFWEMTDFEERPLDTMISQGSHIPTVSASDLEFVEWVNEKRAILKQQYEGELPFRSEVP